MKKNKINILFLFAMGSLFALTPKSYACESFSGRSEMIQSPTDTAHAFVKLAKVTRFYTKEELNKLPKLTLIDIYKSRLAYLIEILPFLSLHPAPGATFTEMSIPATTANVAHLDKESKNKQEFISSLSATLDDVIPYSEKTNIIWSILFFDDMIKKSDYIGTSKGK